MKNSKQPHDIAPDAELGRRERQIMEVLYQGEPLSVADVLKQLANPPSYSAVRTMLGILERKGYVTHEERGRAFYYYPRRRRNEIRGRALSHMLKTFFNDSATDLVAALVDPARQVSQVELDRLATLIEEARKEGR
jgi:BlaI family penicillinase repressor